MSLPVPLDLASLVVVAHSRNHHHRIVGVAMGARRAAFCVCGFVTWQRGSADRSLQRMYDESWRHLGFQGGEP